MATRKRRSAAEARTCVLEVAEKRLGEFGLDGLNIVDVAGDAGMSHATLIHHFGNADDMRRELVSFMTNRLLRDIITVLRSDVALDTETLMRDLFTALSRGGHAKLLAWLAVGGSNLSGSATPTDEVAELFRELIPVLASRLPGSASSERAARQLVFLVANAAIGYGISGPAIADVIGMDLEDSAAFPQWLGARVQQLAQEGQG